jgi:hypothetical protein
MSRLQIRDEELQLHYEACIPYTIGLTSVQPDAENMGNNIVLYGGNIGNWSDNFTDPRYPGQFKQFNLWSPFEVGILSYNLVRSLGKMGTNNLEFNSTKPSDAALLHIRLVSQCLKAKPASLSAAMYRPPCIYPEVGGEYVYDAMNERHGNCSELDPKLIDSKTFTVKDPADAVGISYVAVLNQERHGKSRALSYRLTFNAIRNGTWHMDETVIWHFTDVPLDSKDVSFSVQSQFVHCGQRSSSGPVVTPSTNYSAALCAGQRVHITLQDKHRVLVIPFNGSRNIPTRAPVPPDCAIAIRDISFAGAGSAHTARGSSSDDADSSRKGESNDGKEEETAPVLENDGVYRFMPPDGVALNDARLFAPRHPLKIDTNDCVGSVCKFPDQPVWLLATMQKGSCDGEGDENETHESSIVARGYIDTVDWNQTIYNSSKDQHRKGCRSIIRLHERWRSLPSAELQVLNSQGCAVNDWQCMVASFPNFTAFAPLFPGYPEGPDLQTAVAKRLYGLRHVVYAETSSQALMVFSLARTAGVGCVAERDTFRVSQLNDLDLLGNTEDAIATANAQFVFVRISRRAWELHAMERVVELCEAAKKGGAAAIAIVQKGQIQCSGENAPSRPSVVDFLQLASACIEGTYCPSFNSELVRRVSPAKFSDHKMVEIECPKGSFCMQGVKVDCPIGFTCPDVGLQYPLKCSADPSGQYGCPLRGLVTPLHSAPGTISTAPYAPAFPSPPGFKQTTTPGALPGGSSNSTKILVRCPEGEYCSLGRATSEGKALNCPGLNVCPNSSVIVPTLCTSGGKLHRALP